MTTTFFDPSRDRVYRGPFSTKFWITQDSSFRALSTITTTKSHLTSNQTDQFKSQTCYFTSQVKAVATGHEIGESRKQ
jgi:hypothetical protein